VDVEELAKQAAERVREVVADAERRAAEIVRSAEEDAARIRAGAEAEARERIDGVKRALEELEGRLGDIGPRPGVEAEAERQVAAVRPQPEPEQEPRSAPRADPGVPASPAEAQTGAADESAARLVAMKMALDGASREEIERRLADSYGLTPRAALIDDVLSRAGR
jgi:membrane protein involved in colicin uptake